jgi:hypothetical protein
MSVYAPRLIKPARAPRIFAARAVSDEASCSHDSDVSMSVTLNLHIGIAIRMIVRARLV